MSTTPTLADLKLQSQAAVFVEQQRQFRESVEKMYGHKDLSGDIIAHSISGSIKLMDSLALARAVAVEEPKRILEVGSFLGFSTRVLMDASEPFGSSVTSVDPRIRHRIFDDVKTHVMNFNPEDRLICRDAFFCRPHEPLYYDYLTYEPKYTREQADELLNSIEVIEQPFDTFDFAFIDGDHSYVATVENLLLAAQMMEPGSLIVLHDAISWPDVLPAATDVSAQIDGLGVVGVPGTAEREFFMDWWSKFGGMADNPEQLWNLAGSICDGLCVVRVSEDIDQAVFAQQCRDYLQTTTQVGTVQVQSDEAANHGDATIDEPDLTMHEPVAPIQQHDERPTGPRAEARKALDTTKGLADKVLASVSGRLPQSIKDQIRRVTSK